MSTAKAVVMGAALIAFSVILIGTIPRAEAQRMGPFQLMHHSNTQANAGVFRLDTNSGDVSYCFLTGAGLNEQVRLICSKPVQ
ncbi:MAG: hypothetical protein WBK91_10640 [Alphaproteobacteria bacterium]